MLLRVQRKHALVVVILDLLRRYLDPHAEALLDKSQHIHTLLPQHQNALLRKPFTREKLFPSFLGLAVKLFAGWQILAQCIEIFLRSFGRNLILGLQTRLLQNKIAIDKPLNRLIPRISPDSLTIRKQFRKTTLLIHITIQNQVAIHNRNSSIQLRPLHYWHLRRGRLGLRCTLRNGVPLRCALSRQRPTHKAQSCKRHRHPAKSNAAELEAVCHALERLSNAEKEVEVASLTYIRIRPWNVRICLGVIIENRIHRRIQVVAEVHANWSNRRVVANSQTHRVRVVIEIASPYRGRLRLPCRYSNVAAGSHIRLMKVLDALEHLTGILKRIAHVMKNHEGNTIANQRQCGRWKP